MAQFVPVLVFNLENVSLKHMLCVHLMWWCVVVFFGFLSPKVNVSESYSVANVHQMFFFYPFKFALLSVCNTIFSMK